MGDTRTRRGTNKYPPRECVIRNELTEPKEYRAAKGEQFYFISFHFISFFFFFGWGVRIGLAGSFVECHNKSSTEIQIVTQSHTLRRTEFCGHYGIPDNETKAAAKTKPHDTIQNSKKGPHK